MSRMPEAVGNLILSRDAGEGVVVLIEGMKPFYVKVTELRGSHVRLAFQAEKAVRFIRQEIYEREMSDVA